MGFIAIAAIWKVSAFGQLPAGLMLGKHFNFDSIADGERVPEIDQRIASGRIYKKSFRPA